VTGARLVVDAETILDELHLRQPKRGQPIPVGNTPEESALIKLLSQGLTDGKLLLDKSEIDVQQFNQTLTMLDLHGKLKPLGANHWALT
jgi:predicted Rossmann fold nucleotide-binding protein DprA/Smf involved in DNA uptake